MSRNLLDYNPETEGAEGDLLLFGVPTHRAVARASSSASEFEELEFASAFLDAMNARQLGDVVGRVLSRGGRLAGKPIDPRVAQQLGPRLFRAGQSIRTALTPPAGRSDSEGAAETMEKIIGAELEGLSAEDQEFETARTFVRFAIEAARAAAAAPATKPPAAVAAAAARVAARRFAPGLALIPPLRGFRARRALRRHSLV